MCDYRVIGQPSTVVKIFYFVTQLGHEAVMVFFVLSGYLVGGIAIRRYRDSGFDLLDYASHRIARIYAAFLPALIIFGFFDILGTAMFSSSGLYTQPLGVSSLGQVPAHSESLACFIGNLLMLHTIEVPPFGSNGPLWSLANEWWYYVLFGAAMVIVASRILAIRIAAGVSLLGLLLLLPFSITAWGLMWLTGAAVALYAAKENWKPPLWLSLPIAIVVLAGSRISHLGSIDPYVSKWRFFIDLAIAFGYSTVLLSFHRPGKRLSFPKVHKQMAGFSYSLYLIHFPLMIFTVALLNEKLGLTFLAQPSPARLFYYVMMLVFLLVSAWLFAQVTEVRTSKLRDILMRAGQTFRVKLA
jgi:peptidoglycan/LPS O-acetylase OafA/YrhL